MRKKVVLREGGQAVRIIVKSTLQNEIDEAFLGRAADGRQWLLLLKLLLPSTYAPNVAVVTADAIAARLKPSLCLLLCIAMSWFKFLVGCVWLAKSDHMLLPLQQGSLRNWVSDNLIYYRKRQTPPPKKIDVVENFVS